MGSESGRPEEITQLFSLLREEREVANKGESRRNKGDQGGSQGKIVGKGKSFNAIKTGKSS